ncbi:glycosyltransferase family 4 protein [Selenomonas sp. AB3002]|uniref:glycosyltransferase family 4 protein n=1 Tax=Selenomonas sp. AB3002 TaxID=1392502 RepID=UPI000A517D4A
MNFDRVDRKMKVALVCEWLVTYAGSERVAEAILEIFPQADVYAVVDFLPEEERGWLHGKKVHTTFLQKWPVAGKHYKSYLPLMPLAIEQLDLSGYDLVISSSHCVAKGVLTGPDQLHISYVHSPMRYAWDLTHEYLRETGLDRGLKGWIARLLLHYMRIWDTRTGNGVDHFLANSGFIARRIRKVYGREAQVIYPPVDVDRFTCCEEKEDYYLTASRLVPYKRVKLIVEAFNGMPDKKLIVIGDGPEYESIRAIAGNNIEMLGYQPTEVLKEKMQHARAFVFAAEEDFGITPVEAQACGTPVIAYGKGGALETITAETGMFFTEQSAAAIREAVRSFENQNIAPAKCRKNAERFAPEVFRNSLRECVAKWS